MKDKLFLLFILAFGLFLRLNGQNWDNGFGLHPDERMLVMVTERISLPDPENWQVLFQPESPLNPDFFAYGSLPIYLLKFFSWLVSLFFGKLWMDYFHLFLLGRTLSAFFDLAVVLLVYKISQNLFGKKTALLASFLYASCVFPIQLAHFYAVDSLLNFFIWLTLWYLIVFYQKQNVKNGLKVGLGFGLALATKVSATALVSAIGASLLAEFIFLAIKAFKDSQQNIFLRFFSIFKKVVKKKIVLRVFRNLFFYGGIIITTAFIVFVVFEPYALIDFKNFSSQITAQSQMTKNAYVFPYTLQYVGTKAYLYPLKNIFLYGLGAGLGGLAAVSSVVYLYDLVKRIFSPGDFDKEAKEVIVLVFFLGYFFIVGKFAVKFMRYYLPLYPFLIIVSSLLMVRLKKVVGKSYSLIILFFLTVHLFWTFSFVSIYTRPHSRVAATDWINKNIPIGAKIATEHWDDKLPLAGGEKYSFLEMPMYEPDKSEKKWQIVEENLKTTDYLILSSNRLYTPLQKLADCNKFKVCYSKTAKFYQDLFSGKLGFEKVADFSSYPTFKIGDWRYEINDQGADESFTVYDHPKVIIFKK